MIDELIAIVERARVQRMLVFSTLPVELWRRFLAPSWPADEVDGRLLARASSQNEWLCDATVDDRLVPVVGADATLSTDPMLAHLEELMRRGARGIKIHPALNYVMPDNPGYDPIYGFAAERRIPIVTHGGENAPIYPSDIEYCAPENFVPVLQRHPALRLVVAHVAYPHVDGLLALATDYPNVYTDLSGVLGGGLISGARIAEIVRAFGVERVLFGSDFPYSDPEGSLDVLLDARLTESALGRVLGGNAVELFGLD